MLLISTEFICDCGKQYRHRQSLHIHKKKCIPIQNNNDNSELKMIIDLFKLQMIENKEQKNTR